MGRIAPRKRKTTWDYQTLVRFCQRIIQRQPSHAVAVENDGEREEQEQLPSPSLRERLGAMLQKVWHLPDGYHWMEPLPFLHRRWILIAIALLLIVLLWPYSAQHPQPASTTPVPLTQADNQAAMQAVIIESQPLTSQQQPAATEPPTSSSAPWRQYEIASGQTLAQLFRDNNLPVSDVFAMAQVEGRDKPLSNLRAGQEVKLQLNAQGMVAELEIETTANQTIRFTRGADGAFTRTR
ncbi:LysM-like peptidoglycan-binding domain-containing protein [Pectobacterium carotovorum]|uniref:LysM-like peptidoglycan-binding domain-containing protein n=1 Tax=Pectobacterium carotovorum TaxID=554 RepID=UPI00057EFE03|nr:LysM-like peptidoglycan-binding domain-containing protein [Pectobacterium carotovorum]KHT30612.1 Opacity-associated protein A [Pectobacterium carotovorum subsp. carotovorum]KHT33011.1 Opacity-associated protein A [Pectobacterium carotovorum subsp. carotovorum]MBL0868788.1 Opacity-associated protein A [Pectobacterium carotovorum]MCH4994812.1 Opacity-associated protein A [Pectobacterium carotovorum]UFT93653.1 Opacity-associated protein A [Pectobacterium carotovorum]